MAFSDQFDLRYDVPENWPNLGLYKISFHICQIIFATLIFFLVLPIISAEKYYYDASQTAPNYILCLVLISTPVAVLLALCPWPRFHKDELSRIWRFFLRPRTSAIFTGFFSIIWFLGVLSITSHVNDISNCKLDLKLKKQDPDYVKIWANQCHCAKAVTAFSCIVFFIWLASALCSIILLWHEKKLRLERTREADMESK
ncbi:unnamed protein product [Rhizopus stolonifer]